MQGRSEGLLLSLGESEALTKAQVPTASPVSLKCSPELLSDSCVPSDWRYAGDHNLGVESDTTETIKRKIYRSSPQFEIVKLADYAQAPYVASVDL